MTERTMKIRSATTDDASALAELINFAGEGLPVYLWEGMAQDGQTAWDVGRQRAQREEGSFSYHNAMIAEINGAVAGCLIGYRLPDVPDVVDFEEMPAMFRPLQELEDLAPGTWYVNVLAVYPKFRGSGVGTSLLDVANEQAKATEAAGLSIIVSDANSGARRLYERSGYSFIDDRTMVKDNWQTAGKNWALLRRTI